MTQQLVRILTAVFCIIALCLTGCAGMNATFDKIKDNIAGLRAEKPPIATSLEQMPVDAGAITHAIYKNITLVHDDAGAIRVNFTGAAISQLPSDHRVLRNFRLSEAHLYEHEPSHIKGTLFLEDAIGRRSSVSYEAEYRRTGDTITVETIDVNPIYSRVPEPVMFVVPAHRISPDRDGLPSTFTGMLEFAASRAVNPTQREAGFDGVREYVVMVFLLDRISPSAKFDFMVAEESASYGGYKESTRYMDFDGWRIALLSGKLRLVGDAASPMTTLGGHEGESRLYFKAIYIPGREAGFIRIPKMVGLYCMGGPQG